MMGIMRRLVKLIAIGMRVLRNEGPRSFASRLTHKVQTSILGSAIHLPVVTSDAILVDWSEKPRQLLEPISVKSGPVEIAWIMSPPSATSGGHQNLFRFIDFAERAGHRCTIHFYMNSPVVVNVRDMAKMLSETAAFPNVYAPMTMYDAVRGVGSQPHAMFATGWETAYPVYLDPSFARRFYFVQDFEASFYPVGSEATLAENTYKFGFHGLTAGRWLADKLHQDYGMQTDHFDFAVDKTHYSLVNRSPRNEIFFYARPVTPRRGFELGVMALTDFARKCPDVTINLAGWDVSNWSLPFKYVNHAGLAITELNGLYNRCAAGLVLSMSNMSLLPLELMSSGVTPVMNDAPNNRMVSDSPFIEYVPPTPLAISRALQKAVHREDAVQRSIAMSESVSNTNWDSSGAEFVRAFEKVMRG